VKSKLWVFLILLSVLSAQAATDHDTEARGRALLERGIQVSSLLEASVPPFAADGSISSKAGEDAFRFYWSGQSFRSEAVSGNEYMVGNATTIWEKKKTSLPFDLWTATMQTINFVAPLRHALQEEVSRVHEKKDHGAALECVTTKSKEVRERESCFDANTGVLVSMKTYRDVPNPIGGPMPRQVPRWMEVTTRYEEFQSFHGVLYPQRVEVRFEGEVISRRHLVVSDLKDERTDLFIPMQEAEPWDWCPVMVAPSLTSDVFYLNDPAMDIKKTMIKLVIGEDGRLVSGLVISEQKKGDGDKLLAHYARVKFAPARCGDKFLRGRILMVLSGF
jgi:hypothetical protein